MSLQVSVGRDAQKQELGAYEALELWGNDLRVAGDTEAIARHIHHRWHVSEAPQTFMSLQILGPLEVEILDGSGKKLGPYERFTVVNGVVNADSRVFGFVDVERNDCYLSDLGEHRKGVKLTFYPGR